MPERELSPFQQQLEADIHGVFLNLEEFAEPHLVENKEIRIILAPDQNIALSGGYSLGLADSEVVVYAKSAELPARRESGDLINLDGREYLIRKWNEHAGLAELVLYQHRNL